MNILKLLLILVAIIHQGSCRSKGVKRDEICDDVSADTLTIKDDPDSCGRFIVCCGQVAQNFKCFNDKVWGNGTSTCLSCEEQQEEESYYDDDEEYKRTTKKKFTYKQTKKSTVPMTRKYGIRTKKPGPSISTISEMQTTKINDFTISFESKYLLCNVIVETIV